MEGTGRDGRGWERGKKGAGGGRGGRKGKDEGKGSVVGGSWCLPPDDLFAPRPSIYHQHSGRQEASFELSNTTICPRGSKLWCSDLANENALWVIDWGKIGEGKVGF